MLRSWFANPWAFGVLGVMPVLTLLGFLALRRRRRALARLGNLLTLEILLAPPGWARFLRGFGRSLAITLLVAGAAGPQWGRDYSQSVAPGRDLVVVLDVSRSMLAEQPSRLARAKTALGDLVSTLKQRGGHRVGLVVFAGRARVLCPLTNDYDHFAEVIEGIDGERPPPDVAATDEEASGTRLGAGLRAATDLHDAGQRGFQDLLLLSDGDDPARDGDWRLPAAEARAVGIAVHAVGLGDPDRKAPIPLGDRLLEHDGVPVLTRLEEAALQEIADITEGSYTPAHTRALPLGRLFRERIEPRPVREDGGDPLPQLEQRYPWFLGAALVLLTLDTALGGRTRRNLAAVAPEPEEDEV